MSLYIEEMTLPHEDVEPMHLELYADGTVFFMKAPDDCYEFNAVPVPPHGDLIDRSKIEYTYQMRGGVLMTSNKIIDRLPTIIPTEDEHTMEEFMYGQEGNPNDGSM